MAEIKLNSPLQYIKGVGPRKAEVLADNGLETVVDLLNYFPRQYLDRTNIVPINELKVDQPATIVGEVKAHGFLYGGKSRRRRYEVILQDETGAISLMWFAGAKYWERLFKKGQTWAVSGMVSFFQGYQMVHPDMERLDEGMGSMIHAGRIIPIYPQTAELNKIGLSSKGLRRLTSFVLDNLSARIADYLDDSFLSSVGLAPRHDAYHWIHFPPERDKIETARRRLAFDELLELQFLVYSNKARQAATTKPHSYKPPGVTMTKFREKLSFDLTPGQKRVVKEIIDDLQTEKPMSRLMQGDVGCGKTVVAILAVLYAAENGLQAAFMAPTEILIGQHYRSWAETLESVGVRSAILTASTKDKEKKAIVNACQAGEIDILFGTHALIYDYVSFARLGLVVIDEQHRFGVRQRSKLHAKGDKPDLLVMTATPIPRTLALTLYGDLDVSTIDDMPPGRKGTRTVWRTSQTRDKVMQFVAEEAKKGGQAYIIYPLIEKSEQTDLQAVEDAYSDLTKTVFRDCRVGMVHGRIAAAKRDKTLEKFRHGQTDILMATTVVEVGLDNPNATVLVIEHAERFGLAQLHQLRGRVGRGSKTATVVGLAYPPISEIGRQRLDYFASTSDGFKIAEADLELRGPGEMFGVRQSGLPQLQAVRISEDRDLMESARALLEKMFEARDKLDTPFAPVYRYLSETARARRIAPGGG